MKELWQRLWEQKSRKPGDEDALGRQVYVLYGVYTGIVGAERMILEAGRVNALSYLHAEDSRSRLVGLARMVLEDADIPIPASWEVAGLLDRVENRLSDLLARQAVEERLEQKINDTLEEKHQEYVRDLRMELLNEETGETETPHSKRKLAELEALERVHLTPGVAAQVRPQRLADIVGQEQAVDALLAKIATKYPQHLILYGPPGVGKTTAARLVLDEAKRLSYTPFEADAPFVEVDGSTLRYDEREITNPLIGSVHDPIYQGAQQSLADKGIPEPKPGLVTKAHGGVLFIDEIGEMSPLLLNKLLKVLEDKRVHFESSYYNEEDARVMDYIRKLFQDGAPADFILIGATTRAPEEINPAIRSRCAEVFFSPLAPPEIVRIAEQAAEKLDVVLEVGVADAIAEYTGEGRKAVNLLADAYGAALRCGDGTAVAVTRDDLRRIAQAARLVPERRDIATDEHRVGHVYGLGVYGYLGSALEVEAIAFPAKEKGKGRLVFNGTAGSMAKDSVQNAAAVIRSLADLDLYEYDVHVNVVGGGQIDGPSAGAAITCAMLSALTGKALRQDIAVTGEVSLTGTVKPVGGIMEKAHGAKKAGMKQMLIPAENRDDIPAEYLGMEVKRVATVAEMWSILTGGTHD